MINAGHPRDQAIAASLNNARRHRDTGGANPLPKIKPGYLPPSMFPPLSVDQVAKSLPQSALTPLNSTPKPTHVPQFGPHGNPPFGGYAYGGRMGFAGGGVANSPIPALTPDQIAQFPTLPPPTAVAQPSLTPQPFSSSISSVPMSTLSGGNGVIASVNNQGIPSGSPGAPRVTPNTTFAPPVTPPPSSSSASALPHGITSASESLSDIFGGHVPASLYAPGGVTDYNILNSTYGDLTPSQQQQVQSAIGAKSGGKIPQFAAGGMPVTPWFTKAEARDELHTGGLFGGSQPGRADKSNVSVPADSHVIPADVVAAIGQGNTLAGGNVLTGMFHSGPMGLPLERSRGTPELRLPSAPRPIADVGLPRMGDAKGGEVHGGQTVPIAASSGEFNVNPSGVYQRGLLAAQNMKLDPARLGQEKIMELGHDIIDKFIVKVRKKEIKTLSKLPGPAKS